MSTSSARTQITINLAFVFIKSFFLLLSIWLADLMLSAGTMGLILLLRRQGAFWGNLLQLGFSQGLQKFYLSNPNEDARVRLLVVFVKWVTIASIAISIIAVIYGSQLSLFLFGRTDKILALAFAIYLSGIALGFLACSAWLVEFRFFQSNVIDWLNGSLVFVLCILIGSKLSDSSFALCLSSLTFLATLVSLFIFRKKFINKDLSPYGNWSIERPIFYYSLTRGLTAFADMGTVTIGPWLLKDSPVQAGHLIISYTVLRMVQTFIMPIAQVLALRANSYRHECEKEERRIFLLGLLSFASGCVIVGMYYAVGQFFINLWVPNSASQVVYILDQLMVFTPAVCLFYSLRNYIELKYMVPWNLIIMTLSLIGLFSGYYLSDLSNIDAVVLGSKIMFSILMIYSFVFTFYYYLNSRTVK